MPSLEHNGFIDMFRENPALAPHFLATLFHFQLPPYTSVAVVDSSLDQLIPVEFRADLVLELRDATDTLVLAIVLEVQRTRDPDKKFSWPVYLTATRAAKRCPTCVLVIAVDEDVAAWASEAIDLGLGRSIAPIVLGPSVIPEIADPVVAERETELAILSAIVHGNGPNGLAVVQAVLGAFERFDAAHAVVYFQIVYDALREPLRRALEALIMERQSELKGVYPPFAQALIDRGEQRGELKGKRDALLRVLTRAGIALSDDGRARISACTDLATLDRWLDNVLGAKTLADVLS